MPSAMAYVLRLKEVGTTTWQTVQLETIGTQYNGLNNCSQYEFQIKTICTNGESSFSPLMTFTTSNCEDSNLCIIQGENTNYEWIQKVDFANISNNSGNNFGYAEFSNQNITVSANNTYNLQLTPGFANQIFPEYWKVWIDFNNNGNFTDAGELLFDTETPVIGTVNTDIAIPNNITNTQVVMRIAMKWIDSSTDPLPPQACTSFEYGEVEDYLLSVVYNDGCSGTIDECGVCNGNGIITWYEDADGDGLGNPLTFTLDCEQPTNYVSNSADEDDNCIGSLDECGICNGLGALVWYEDADGDGLGNPNVIATNCNQPAGFVSNGIDTNDNIVLNNNEILSANLVANIFPIPTAKDLNIQFFTNKNEMLVLDIFDINGKKIIQKNLMSNIGENHYIIDLSEQFSGVYFLNMGNAEQIYLSKQLLKL